MQPLPTRTSSSPQGSVPIAPKLATGVDAGITAPSARPVTTSRSESTRTTADVASDKATAALIRRTLCAHHVSSNILAGGEKGKTSQKPLDELLPPLTSSNEVDLQLYGIISVIIKEFVNAWYAKITPDHVFVDEVIQIIAHCTRALEQRLRQVDLEALILDEAPRLVENHIDAYRTSCRISESNPLASDYRNIYHTLTPHPALDPVPSEADPVTILEQQENEAAWRQLLVQGVLAVLLPTEDLENGCLRALVVEIFSEMIIGNGVGNKVCEPWLLWEATEKIAQLIHPRVAEAGDQALASGSAKTTSRLEQFGLLTSPPGDAVEPRKQKKSRGRPVWSIGDLNALFWNMCQYTFLAFTALRAIITALTRSPSLPDRSVGGVHMSSPMDASRQSLWSNNAAPSATVDEPWPVLSMSAWTCAAQLLEFKARMPWLAGLVSLLHWGAVSGPGQVGGTNNPLDKLLSHHLRSHLLNPALLPPLLRTLRAALFPNNAPAPARVAPSPEEELAIKRRAAQAVVAATPAAVRPRLFGRARSDDAVQRRQVERLLDVLGDPYLNKHLVFGLIELIVVRLLPELGEKGVDALMEERLGYSL
ncbi:PXA domain-containing protein [Phyllosticta citrichinensis]|uniref:PXA domain-containing protein n=1 Tax=Phyllosticta citrichinensis TaxID=1130410 RepID=A0ABR1XGH1_9PEZI